MSLVGSVDSSAFAFGEWISSEGVNGILEVFNRNSDAVANEKNVTVLSEDKEKPDDLYNASWIKFKSHDRMYISAQSPCEHAFEPFIRLLWQQQIRLVVCLDEIPIYCPQNKEKFGRFNVTLNNSHGVFRLIEIIPDGWEYNELLVTVVTMSGNVQNPVGLLKSTRQLYKADLLINPILVHSNSRVRTGAFILTDALLMRLFNAESVKVEEHLLELLNQRSNVIGEREFVSSLLAVMIWVNKRVEGFEEEWKKLKKAFNEKYNEE